MNSVFGTLAMTDKIFQLQKEKQNEGNHFQAVHG
jgi:hypothetical protein